MSSDYGRGFSDALEIALEIFNRLKAKSKLKDPCLNCKFVEQMGQLLLLAKNRQYEKIENELGYFLR